MKGGWYGWIIFVIIVYLFFKILSVEVVFLYFGFFLSKDRLLKRRLGKGFSFEFNI